MEQNQKEPQEKDYDQILRESKRKIRILKEALLNERKENCSLQDKLYELTEKLKKNELENKKRQQKNEALLLQIRSLKDALIAEKSEKKEYMQELKVKQSRQQAQGNTQNNLSFSNMFGLKKLFQK